MSHPSDEFGESLDDMFPNLGDDTDMPELERLTDFGQGPTFRQVPSPYIETHLVTLFTVHNCAICHSRTRTAIGFAVRRFHHTRNTCIEYQSILPEMYQFFDHLPKAYKEHDQYDPFCVVCSDDAGFIQDADLL